MSQTDIAVVIPHYQRTPGLLTQALRSAFAQTIADRIHVFVVDDESPHPAADDVEQAPDLPSERITVIRQPNGGAGAARNAALDHVPDGTALVAFLDSDDTWRPHHLESAARALDCGFDAYFSDWWSFNFPDNTNFQRIGSPPTEAERRKDSDHRIYELRETPIQHIVSEGGGVIQTSTVVYRFAKFPKLRFREQFYNGQDFFFWMDLGELGARFCFSLDVGCENGEGVNIFQGAGWGTERSLQRLRNELFIWTSVKRFYALSPDLESANRRTIRHLQHGVVRDVMHRVRRGLPISRSLLKDIVSFDPAILVVTLVAPFRVVFEKVHRRPA